MGTITKIQWTDHTFNPWIGCRKVAPECANCYAETLDRNRFSKTLGGTKDAPVSHWGSGPRHRTSASNWREPLKWNKAAEKTIAQIKADIGNASEYQSSDYERPRVFCASLSDWLDDENVPVEWLADLLKLIHDTPHLDWLLLTKRPQNWRPRITEIAKRVLNLKPGDSFAAMIWAWKEGFPPGNVWIGVSAGADQSAALDIPAKVHFLSCEPMLKPFDATYAAHFDWIIFGGESGKKARPCDIAWIRDGVETCHLFGIAPFVKQLGANVECIDAIDAADHFPAEHVTLSQATRPNYARVHLNESHGADMEEWPADLRVRDFPLT